MDKWLNTQFGNTVDKFDDTYILPEQRKYFTVHSNRKFSNTYCSESDIDKRFNFPNINEFSEIYVDADADGSMDNMDNLDNFTIRNVVNIYPATNKSHCNFLFRTIIECIKDSKMTLQFCYIDKNNTMQKVTKPIMSVDDKCQFYDFCYTNSVQKMYENSKDSANTINTTRSESTPYRKVPINTLKYMFDTVNTSFTTFNAYVLTIWNNIIKTYLTEEYQKILCNLGSGTCGYIIFLEFMSNLPVIKTMSAIRERLVLTLKL